MSFLVGFAIGFLVGAGIGFFTAALCSAAKDGDEMMLSTYTPRVPDGARAEASPDSADAGSPGHRPVVVPRRLPRV